MKIFIRQFVIFMLPLALLFVSGIFLPTTPRASKSLLFAIEQSDSLLINTKEPRIIFIGGSNLSFGLNSQMIHDSLSINPINTAVHAGIGIRFMLENTLKYIQEGDVIIMAFEYYHFLQSYNNISDELFRAIVDVNTDKIDILSLGQKISILSYLPRYSLSKFKPSEYFGFGESDIYSVNSFNKYGDTDAHWDMKDRDYEPIKIQGKLNMDVVNEIKHFVNTAKKMGAKEVYLTFPSLDEISFELSEDIISQIENVVNEKNFKTLGTPRRYSMPEEMMFNTHYHLNKRGVDYRTQLLIEDIKIQEGK